MQTQKQRRSLTAPEQVCCWLPRTQHSANLMVLRCLGWQQVQQWHAVVVLEGLLAVVLRLKAAVANCSLAAAAAALQQQQAIAFECARRLCLCLVVVVTFLLLLMFVVWWRVMCLTSRPMPRAARNNSF